MANEAVDSILEKYIPKKRERGVFTQAAFDKYVPVPEPVQEPVIVNGVSSSVPLGSNTLAETNSIERIAKPVLTSWLKGKGGLSSVSRNNAWDTDTIGGVTANEYWRRAKAFDNPSLPLDERLTQMIYGVETSGNPQGWKTVNKFGYMGRAQMGKAIMSDYGIDPTLYMSDPNYQHQQTVKTVGKRISELKGRYFRHGGKVVSNAINHHGNSKKEDLVIINPNDGSFYGAMRVNEVVFSQKDSDMIDKLISQGKSEKLGQFVAKARSKHQDVNFMKGGGKLRKIENGYLVDSDGRVYQQVGSNLYRVGRMEEGAVKLMAEQKVNASEFNIPSPIKRRGSVLDEIMATPMSILNSITGTPSNPTSKPLNKQQQVPSAPSREQIRLGKKRPISSKSGSSSGGSGTGSILPEQTAVKVTQEYLNNFFATNAARQKGYSVGKDGAIFDDNGKRVPIDTLKSEAKNEQINVDGRFGPETEAAIKIYNTANPDRQIKYRALSDGSLMLENTGFSKDTPDYLKKYYENGKVPIYNSIGDVKALTPKTAMAEIGIKEATPTIAPATPAATPTAPVAAGSSVFNSDNLRRIGGNLADTFKIAALARQAGQPLPQYEQTEDWKKYTAMVENQATQGLNSAVQSQFNRNMNRNRALGYGQVTAAAGGGGSSGAVLGALGNINQASADAIGNFAVADQAQRDQNLSRFGQVAQTNENINLSMFSNELQNAQNSRVQAASMIPAVASQIEGRNDFYNAYGPNSSYQKFLDIQLQKQQEEVALKKRLAENPSLLFPTGMSDVMAVSEADKALIEANKKRLGLPK